MRRSHALPAVAPLLVALGVASAAPVDASPPPVGPCTFSTPVCQELKELGSGTVHPLTEAAVSAIVAACVATFSGEPCPTLAELGDTVNAEIDKDHQVCLVIPDPPQYLCIDAGPFATP